MGYKAITFNNLSSPTLDMVLAISGNTAAPATPTEGTITFSATENLDVVATGNVAVETTISDDALFEGVQLRQHSLSITCPNGGSGSIIVSGASKIVSLGNHNGASDPTATFYTGDNASAPVLTWNLNEIPANVVKIRQANTLLTILPATGNKALPTGLTFLRLTGDNLNWTYSGALPTGLTYLILDSNSINWTGTTIGNPVGTKPNLSSVFLSDYRTNAMDYDDLFLILDSFRDNVGNMPTSVHLRDQIAANVTAIAAVTVPDELGTEPEKAKFKIEFLKTDRSIETFNLNLTAI